MTLVMYRPDTNVIGFYTCTGRFLYSGGDFNQQLEALLRYGWEVIGEL